MAKRTDRRMRRSGAPPATFASKGKGASSSRSQDKPPSAKRSQRSSASTLANRVPVAKTGRRQPKSTLASLIELVIIVFVALGLALGLQRFLVKPFQVPSGSMEPTLKIGQRFLGNRIGMSLNGPHVGEIAVFHPPTNAEEQLCGPEPHVVRSGGQACDAPVAKEETGTNYVKRVVAGPGDEIYIREGHVYRKAAGTSTFVREHDHYINPCGGVSECNFPTPIRIPPGHWFMMGDNRGQSDDSRYWGPVPTKWFIAGAIATYWPPDRVGFF